VVGDAVKHKSKVKIHEKCFQHATNDMIIAGGGTTVFTARRRTAPTSYRTAPKQ